MPTSSIETKSRNRNRPYWRFGATVAGLMVSACTTGQPSAAEQLRSAQHDITAYTLGQLAGKACKVDTSLNVCSTGEFAQDYHRTAANSLVIDYNEGVATLRSSFFTNDGARTAYDTRLTYAVAPVDSDGPDRKLATRAAAAMIQAGTVKSLECKSVTPSKTSSIVLAFGADGKPSSIDSSSQTETAATCLTEALSALTGSERSS